MAIQHAAVVNGDFLWLQLFINVQLMVRASFGVGSVYLDRRVLVVVILSCFSRFACVCDPEKIGITGF